MHFISIVPTDTLNLWQKIKKIESLWHCPASDSYSWLIGVEVVFCCSPSASLVQCIAHSLIFFFAFVHYFCKEWLYKLPCPEPVWPFSSFTNKTLLPAELFHTIHSTDCCAWKSNENSRFWKTQTSLSSASSLILMVYVNIDVNILMFDVHIKWSSWPDSMFGWLDNCIA